MAKHYLCIIIIYYAVMPFIKYKSAMKRLTVDKDIAYIFVLENINNGNEIYWHFI